MSIVTRDYQGHAITYQDDGWFNATTAASKWGKRPVDWLALQSTKDYLEALKSLQSDTGKTHITRKGGDVRNPDNVQGTWMHPKLAVRFSQWLDPHFAVWCDAQIDSLIRGKDDWRKLRHQAASSFKVANDILKMVRADQGKATESHHYSNEARLVNWALMGEFKGLDRESLLSTDLALLAHLEERNAVLIGRGLTYEQRKPIVKQYAMDWRMSHAALPSAARSCAATASEAQGVANA